MRSPLALVLALAALLTLPGLATKEFYTRGEPREAIVMQSILSGEWVLPKAYGDAVPSKPPAMHWAAALLSEPFGRISEATARFPSAVASIVFAGVLFVFLARRVSSAEALAAPLILITSAQWFGEACNCRVDMFFAACFAGGLLAFYSWFERGSKEMPFFAILLLMGATLTKGPVSIVLPAAIAALWLLYRRAKPADAVWRLALVFGPVLLISFSWYLSAWLKSPQLFLSKVWDENFARFFSTMDEEPHKHGPAYLVAVAAAGLLPWSLVALPALPLLRRLRLGRCRALAKEHPLHAFAALVCGCVFLFFLIPASKRGVYLLPAYPFAAILLARAFVAFPLLVKSARVGASFLALAVITCGALTLALAGVGFSPADFVGDIEFKAFAEQALRRVVHFPLYAWIMGAVLFVTALGAALRVVTKKERARNAEAVLLLSFLALLNTLIFPVYAGGLSSKPFAEQIAGKVAVEQRLCSYQTEFYGLSFYLKRSIYRFAPDASCAAVLMNVQDLAEFVKANGKISILATSSYGLTDMHKAVALVRLTTPPG